MASWDGGTTTASRALQALQREGFPAVTMVGPTRWDNEEFDRPFMSIEEKMVADDLDKDAVEAIARTLCNVLSGGDWADLREGPLSRGYYRDLARPVVASMVAAGYRKVPDDCIVVKKSGWYDRLSKAWS